MSKTNLTRRSFVKVSALAGAAAAVGASMAGCMQEAAPEEELAGTGEAGVSSTEGLTKMRTSCHGCIQMCPAIAYLKDGVVVRLEGDPEAPVSRGSLCIKGLNQLHTMYSPRRILHPLRRAGERGGGHLLGRGHHRGGYPYQGRYRPVRQLRVLRQRGRRRLLLVHGGHDASHGLR